MGRLAATEGNIEEAIREFDRAVELDPEAPYLRLEYADLLYRLRRVPEATEQVNLAYEHAPHDPEVLRLYGQIHFASAGSDRDSLRRSEEAFAELRSVAPEDIPAMITLAQIYEATGRSPEAVEVVRELVSHHPDNRQLKRALVDLLRDAGRQADAEELLGEILRLDSEALDSRIELAGIESQRGNHTQAIEILRSASAEISKHPRILRALAEEHLRRAGSPGIVDEQRTEDLDTAEALIAELSEAGALDELEVRALSSEIAWQRDQRDAAVAQLERAVERDPGNLWFTRQLTSRLLEMRRPDDAAKVLESAIAANDDPDEKAMFRRMLIGVHQMRGDPGSAADLLADLLVDEADEEMRQSLFGDYLSSLLAADRTEEALRALDAEEDRVGLSNSLRLGRAEVLARQGKENKARRIVLEEMDPVEMRPAEIFRLGALMELLELGAAVREARPGLALRLGQYHSYQSDFASAIPMLELALASGEEALPTQLLPETHFWLGQAQERTGSLQAAAVSFERVIELEPDNSDALNYLGYMWAEQGTNLDRAVELIERAVALEPENGAYADSLGWALYRLGRFEDARGELERAVTLVPEDPTVLEHLGDVYLALDLPELARSAYQRALQSPADDGNSEQVREKLAELSGR